MMRFRISGTALVAACVLSGPALMAAFVEHTVDVRTAVVRFAVALAFAVVGLTVIESIVQAYRSTNVERSQQAPTTPQLRRDDPGFDPAVRNAR